MVGCLKLRKNAKIQAIARHVQSQGLMEIVNNLDNDNKLDNEGGTDSESSDDDMDEVKKTCYFIFKVILIPLNFKR